MELNLEYGDMNMGWNTEVTLRFQMCSMSPLPTSLPQKSLEYQVGTGTTNSDTQESLPTTQSKFINPILKCVKNF